MLPRARYGRRMSRAFLLVPLALLCLFAGCATRPVNPPITSITPGEGYQYRTRTGVMVHRVPDEGVDDGPVLATVEVPINLDDTFESLQARIHAAEHRLLVDAIRGLIAPSPTTNEHETEDAPPDDTKATSP